MRLLVDMNLSPRWVPFLLEAGFKADHWADIGKGDAADHELVAWAAAHGAIVLTADLDFSALLAASGAGFPSVIQIRDELPSPERTGDALIEALVRLTEEIAQGALVTLDAGRSRVRVLPIDR